MDARDTTKIWLRGIRRSLSWDGQVEVEHFDEEVREFSEEAKEAFTKKLVDADLAGLRRVDHDSSEKLMQICQKFRTHNIWITDPDELYIDFGNGWHTDLIKRRHTVYNGVCKKMEQ